MRVGIVGLGSIARKAYLPVVTSWPGVTPVLVSRVAAGGRSPICPIVALDGAPGCVTPSVETGTVIQAGEALFEWD